MSIAVLVLFVEQNKIKKLSLIQSGGGTKDLGSHGNPFLEEGANLSEYSNNKRIVSKM